MDLKFNCLMVVYIYLVIEPFVQDVFGAQTADSSGVIGPLNINPPTNTTSDTSSSSKVLQGSGIVGGSSGSETNTGSSSSVKQGTLTIDDTMGSVKNTSPNASVVRAAIIAGILGFNIDTSSSSNVKQGTAIIGGSAGSNTNTSSSSRVIQGTGIVGGSVGSETNTSSSSSVTHGTVTIDDTMGTITNTSSSSSVTHGTAIVGGSAGSNTNTSDSSGVIHGTAIIRGSAGSNTNTSSSSSVTHGTAIIRGSAGSNTNTSSSSSVTHGTAIIGGRTGSNTNTSDSSGVIHGTGIVGGSVGSETNTTGVNTGTIGSNVTSSSENSNVSVTTSKKTDVMFGGTNDSTDTSSIVKIDCGHPSGMVNAYKTLTGTSLYDTIDVYCPSGVVEYGSLTRTCQSNGTWSGYPPKCKSGTGRVECRHPDFRNGSSYFKYRPYYVGYGVQYKCDYGHIYVSGDLNRTCQADTSWSGSPPICRIIRCPIPSAVANANSFVQGQNFENTIQYICTPPFVYESGSLTRTCLENEEWSGVPPVCGSPLTKNSWPVGMQRSPGCKGLFEQERQNLIKAPDAPVFTFTSFIQRIRSMAFYGSDVNFCLRFLAEFNVI